MIIRKAKRIQELPPYLFAEIDKKKNALKARGVDIISLGIGDPDLPTPAHIVERLQTAAADPINHRYPDYEGLLAFRQAAARWYRTRFGVVLDPETEVVSLIGSKEGIAHMPIAFVDPDDIVLSPDPGYPVYTVGTGFCGGAVHRMPLTKSNGFVPDLQAIPASVAKAAKLMWLCYPNNPTSAVATRAFFRDAVEFARKNEIIICHDAAYSEIYFDGEKPISFLEVDGAREVGIEFHSLSKTFNMTGWRVGFAVGNAELVAGLGKVKTNVDSGVFQAVQEAAIAALGGDQSCVDRAREIYQSRRDLVVKSLAKAGLETVSPRATFYVWVETPRGYTSAAFATKVLEETGVVITPGTGFGPSGEGYVRLSLTVNGDRLSEAVGRIERLSL
ncbi:MAG TPA: LL-diaminopimelate aminotransferase [Candidatus Binatia bacterium]|nr:LL-diaminopimelate aminotransferase [Candidatus Binatia bacterium]